MNLKYVSDTQNKSAKPFCAAVLTQTNFTKNLLLSVVKYEFFKIILQIFCMQTH